MGGTAWRIYGLIGHKFRDIHIISPRCSIENWSKTREENGRQFSFLVKFEPLQLIHVPVLDRTQSPFVDAIAFYYAHQLLHQAPRHTFVPYLPHQQSLRLADQLSALSGGPESLPVVPRTFNGSTGQ